MSLIVQVCAGTVLSGTCNTEESLINTICRSFLAAPKCHLSPSWQQIWAPQHVLKFPQQGMSTQWYYTDYTLLNHQSLETTSEGQDEHGKSFQRCNISMIWHDLANMVPSFLSTLTRDSESWMIVLKDNITFHCTDGPICRAWCGGRYPNVGGFCWRVEMLSVLFAQGLSLPSRNRPGQDLDLEIHGVYTL